MNETNLPYLAVELTGKAFNKLGWLTEEETHFSVVLPAYRDLVNALTKTLIVFGWLAIFAFQNHASIYSTVAYDANSTFWQFCDNGGIENCTWLNVSSGLAQQANGDNLPDALSRFKWVHFDYMVARINNGNLQGITINNMDSWQTSNSSTNTSWQASARDHESIGQRNVDLLWQYSQTEFDNLVSYHLEANATPTLNSPTDVYLVVALKSIDIGGNGDCDSIVYSTTAENGTFRQQTLCANSSTMIYNVTSLKVEDYAVGKAWDFAFEQNVSTFVFLKPQAGQHGETINAQVFIGFSIGKTLTKTALDFQAIDAACATSCGPGDAIHVGFDFTNFPGANQVEENYSLAMQWYDDLGTCSISNCNLAAYSARSDVTGTGYSVISGYGNANSWTVCDLANTTPEYQCESGVATKTNPQKGVWYNLALINAGRFSRPAGFFHLVGVNLGGTSPCVGCSDLVPGLDTVRPLMPFFYINGATVANNSVVNVYSTNGSLLYANFTAGVQFGDSTKDYGGNNGTLNLTGVRLNRTSWGFNLSSSNNIALWLPSYLQSVYYENQRNGTPFQLCAYANGTNRGTGTGDSNFSTTGAFYCWWATLNIIPVPVSNPTPFAAKPGYRKDDDDTLLAKQGYNWWWVLIPLTLLLVFLYNQKRT